MLNQPIVFFDGLCNLCSNAVQFILKYDKHQRFHFASIQGATAAQMLPAHLTISQGVDSIVFLENGKFYTKSTAALRIAKHLKFPVNLCYVFMLVPAVIRNVVYDLIARNRYKWFGKKEVCWLPSPELSSRFLP